MNSRANEISAGNILLLPWRIKNDGVHVTLTLQRNFRIFFLEFSRHPLQVVLINVLSFLPAALLGYLIGSIPTAYLIVKWKSKIDIRHAGSGNVGTLNSFEVTRSKFVGITVLVLDLFKGVLAVLLGRSIFGGDFVAVSACGISVVLGHNFPIWLGFKGGRGLAPAAGVMLMLGWVLVAVWGLGWGLGFSILRRVNIGNIIATILLMVFVVVAPGSLLGNIVAADATTTDFKYFTVLFLMAILLKHIDPLKEYIKEKRQHH